MAGPKAADGFSLKSILADALNREGEKTESEREMCSDHCTDPHWDSVERMGEWRPLSIFFLNTPPPPLLVLYQAGAVDQVRSSSRPDTPEDICLLRSYVFRMGLFL